VTESSHVLLLLADARCPPLHLPPSLRTYVQNLKPHKEVILVLTKSDLVDPEALAGWREWVKVWWAKGYKAAEGKGQSGDEETKGEVQVVAVHSYDTTALYAGKSFNE
jgi:ribosome biogenesis GTPase A